STAVTRSTELYALSLHDALPIFAKEGDGTLAVAVLAAIPGLMKFDALYWWAGRLWGERFIMALPVSKRVAKHMARVQQAGRKVRSEEHTSELQSRVDLVCRLLLE